MGEEVEENGGRGKYMPSHRGNFSGLKPFRCFHVRIGKSCPLYKVE